jgi:hypothetical protein
MAPHLLEIDAEETSVGSLTLLPLPLSKSVTGKPTYHGFSRIIEMHLQEKERKTLTACLCPKHIRPYKNYCKALCYLVLIAFRSFPHPVCESS